MTVLVDTGVVYADHDTDGNSRRKPRASARGGCQDEAVTLTPARSDFTPAKRLGERLRGVDPYPPVYEMFTVSDAVFEDAVEISERYDDQTLSFTDATTVALCDRHTLDRVMSFDDGFDGIVDRTDPTTI
jgi:predicted nucleic acid-binding protein